MEELGFQLRPGRPEDFEPWMALYEQVAAEGKWIGGEVPVDRERFHRGYLERFVDAGEAGVMFLAESADELVGHLGIQIERGVADLGMMVTSQWRGRGVGSALMDAAVRWAKESGAHKIVLQVWPHNQVARALYEKFGFVEEGRLRRHYRRRNGELWDAIAMGLVLDLASPGCPFDPAG